MLDLLINSYKLTTCLYLYLKEYLQYPVKYIYNKCTYETSYVMGIFTTQLEPVMFSSVCVMNSKTEFVY